MGKIRILPEILSNKIAAGEVVERPASVVKELLENCLDAGSTRILVEVENGGHSSIRVSDDGAGMGHDDALLSLERYATSKIFTDDDLFAIHTLGFRGEALPSIASVSRMILVSRPASEPAGTQIEVEGGKIKKVCEAGAPPGTLVEVRQLFFNTPARRKFLKGAPTEMGHITETVARMALAWPKVRMELHHNGKLVEQWAPVSEPLQRVRQVLGADEVEHLIQVEYEDSTCRVSGWTGTPQRTRATMRGIYLYVNRRPVRDRVLTHALLEAYGSRLMKRQFPMAVLFVDLPAQEVDVNVHPSKALVRMHRQDLVHGTVQRAVANCLEPLDKPRWTQDASSGSGRGAVTESVSTPLGTAPSPPAAGVVARGKEPERPRAADQASLPLPAEPASVLRFVGQVAGTYLVCESAEGLFLIDQHAAHERVLFEQFRNNVARKNLPIQKLLIPETVELAFREAQILGSLVSDLARAGVEIEPFGGNSFVVRAVPALLSHRPMKPLLEEMVERIAEVGYAPGLEKTLDECLVLMACHGAIRAHETLDAQETRALLRQLQSCRHPSQCPHGRPTWIRWTFHELERSFRRT